MTTMYVDDYGALDTHYLVHATPINPCAAHEQEDYLIGCILHVGTEAMRCSLDYPTRSLRDAAFEALGALLRARARADAEAEMGDDLTD